ncbi:hypothetical protein [Paenarthrobacter sp. YIM B13468]|uniref:hypothetical protein n=1 Tax=Paenarthrobacter sp. YIM B13468 TaxID=3366295 RepID=UPI00366DD9AF
MDEQNIDVFIGLDVGISGHHAAPMAPRFPHCPASLSDEKIRPSPPPTYKRTETTNLKSPPGLLDDQHRGPARGEEFRRQRADDRGGDDVFYSRFPAKAATFDYGGVIAHRGRPVWTTQRPADQRHRWLRWHGGLDKCSETAAEPVQPPLLDAV